MTERLVILDTSETESGFSVGRILPAFWGFMRRWPVIPVIVLIFLVILAVFAPLIAPQ